jgi:protein-disulfide isomerase
MTSTEKPTRKQRRAAERAARKGGGTGTTPVQGSRGGGSNRSMLVISAAAIGIGVVAVVALVLASGGLDSTPVSAISEPDTPAAAEELRQGRTLVAPDASPAVKVEVFEDAQCPHCGNFTRRIEPLLIAEHVANGTASFDYRDYIVFGQESLDAAVAMRAADELGDAFWDFQHWVFYNQEGGEFSRSWLADIAESVGLDRAAFLELLDDEDLQAGVSADMAAGQTYGVSSTPAVIINGENIGSPTWEELDAAIQEAAAEAAA